MKVLSATEVAAKTSMSVSNIRRMVREGKFPPPFALTENRQGWLEQDVDEWISERVRSFAFTHKKTGCGTTKSTAKKHLLQRYYTMTERYDEALASNLDYISQTIRDRVIFQSNTNPMQSHCGLRDLPDGSLDTFSKVVDRISRTRMR